MRLTLVPSFFTLLGEKTSYVPRWLDRVLPGLTVEPPHDGNRRPQAGAEHPVEARART